MSVDEEQNRNRAAYDLIYGLLEAVEIEVIL